MESRNSRPFVNHLHRSCVNSFACLARDRSTHLVIDQRLHMWCVCMCDNLTLFCHFVADSLPRINGTEFKSYPHLSHVRCPMATSQPSRLGAWVIGRDVGCWVQRCFSVPCCSQRPALWCCSSDPVEDFKSWPGCWRVPQALQPCPGVQVIPKLDAQENGTLPRQHTTAELSTPPLTTTTQWRSSLTAIILQLTPPSGHHGGVAWKLKMTCWVARCFDWFSFIKEKVLSIGFIISSQLMVFRLGRFRSHVGTSNLSPSR